MNVGKLIRCPALKACVTVPSDTSETLVTDVASGLLTRMGELPSRTLAGAELILGRAPLKRYGGENTS